MSEEEIEKYQFVVKDNGLATWDLTILQEKEVDLTKVEVGMITDSLAKLNREHKLTPNHISLYEKFVDKQ